MKIIKDDDVFILPEKYKYIILAENENRDKLLACLNEYFNKKKKNYCKVHSDDDEWINPKEFNYIYVPEEINNEMEFKPKSQLNLEISQMIVNNPESFLSIDQIRNDLHGLLTDHGMYRLREILSNGLGFVPEIMISNFDVSLILSMLEIYNETLTIEQKRMIIYNLLIYIKRMSPMIVYIDFKINQEVLDWFKSFPDESIIIMNNNFKRDVEIPGKYAMIKLSNQDFLEKYDFDSSEFQSISYILNPFVSENIDMQTEKNIRLFNQFKDNETTFCLEFNSLESL